MKIFKIALLVIFLGLTSVPPIQAVTTTPNIGLKIPDLGVSLPITDPNNFAVLVNANLTLIDNQFGGSFPSLTSPGTWTATQTFIVAAEFADGTAALPSITFDSELGTGLYHTSGIIHFSISGIKKMDLSSAGLSVLSGISVTENATGPGAAAVITQTGTSDALHVMGGDVGIGTTTPTSKLDVTGTGNFSGLTTFGAGISVNAETITDLTGAGLTNLAGVLTSDPVTLAGTPDYLTIAGQVITRNQLVLSTDLATFSSADLSGRLTDETGTGAVVFDTTPTFTTSLISPMIIGGTGTASSLTLKTTTGIGTTSANIHFLVGNNGATEAMTILNGGNIGIGTANPATRFEMNTGVATFTDADITLTNGQTLLTRNSGSGTTLVVNQQGFGDIVNIQDGGAEILTILDGGNVGINMPAPSSKLHIVGNQIIDNINDTNLTLKRAGSNIVYLGDGGVENGGQLHLYDNVGVSQVTLRESGSSFLNGGNVGIGTTIPTSKLDVNGSFKSRGTSAFADSSIVASAGVLALPVGNLFHVSGITTITTLNTCDAANNGRFVSLIFDGILTLTDGSNLKLAGGFITTADDTIQLVCDGVNWYEMSRSVN